MSEQEIRALVWQIAVQSADRGPGWSQEGVVLREIRDHITGGRGGGLCNETHENGKMVKIGGYPP